MSQTRTAPGTATARRRVPTESGRSVDSQVPYDVRALEPRREGSAVSIARRLGGWHPAAVFAVTTVVGAVVLSALAIAIGLLLVHVLLPFHALGRADEDVNDWLAAHRTHGLNTATFVGSAVGDIPAVPGLVALTALVSAVLRRWRVAAFMVGAILIEVTTYRVTSLLVHRERPTVPRLDHLPVNQSYPSGHVAASVVVYVGLALLLTSWARKRWVTVACWTLAVALPVLVACSRLYRGMHHPTDAGVGALVGFGAIAIALLAARAAGSEVRIRSASGRA